MGHQSDRGNDTLLEEFIEEKESSNMKILLYQVKATQFWRNICAPVSMLSVINAGYRLPFEQISPGNFQK